MKHLTKFQVATAIAIFFHFIGLTGILFFDREFFIRATPINLLLSFALLLWTQPGKNRYFALFIVLVFCLGFSAEIIGINTGLLFGDYKYGTALGFQWRGVPLVIGINWIIVICCCGICTHTLITKAIASLATGENGKVVGLKAISVIVDGATLAVMFDWLMEPVAVKLGFWTWNAGGRNPDLQLLLLVYYQRTFIDLVPFSPLRQTEQICSKFVTHPGHVLSSFTNFFRLNTRTFYL